MAMAGWALVQRIPVLPLTHLDTVFEAVPALAQEPIEVRLEPFMAPVSAAPLQKSGAMIFHEDLLPEGFLREQGEVPLRPLPTRGAHCADFGDARGRLG